MICAWYMLLMRILGSGEMELTESETSGGDQGKECRISAIKKNMCMCTKFRAPFFFVILKSQQPVVV